MVICPISFYEPNLHATSGVCKQPAHLHIQSRQRYLQSHLNAPAPSWWLHRHAVFISEARLRNYIYSNLIDPAFDFFSFFASAIVGRPSITAVDWGSVTSSAANQSARRVSLPLSLSLSLFLSFFLSFFPSRKIGQIGKIGEMPANLFLKSQPRIQSRSDANHVE